MRAQPLRLGLPTGGLLGLVVVWACGGEGPAEPEPEEPEPAPGCGPGREVPLTSLRGYIAFVAGGQLGAVCPDGSDLRAALGPVVDTAATFYFDPSPDGSRVLVTSQRPTGAFDLFDVASGTATPLTIPTTSEVYGLRRATWSPNGRNVAYLLNDAEIAIGEVVGTTIANNRTLVPTGELCKGILFSRSCPVFLSLDWSPLGDSIAYTHKIVAISGTQLGVLDIITGTGRGIPSPNDPNATAISTPLFSPDGGRVAFGYSSIYGEPAPIGIWVMQADGSGSLNLTDGASDRTPSWSPDGSEIAFVREGDIWVVPAAGGTPRLVADLPGPGARQAVWVR